MSAHTKGPWRSTAAGFVYSDAVKDRRGDAMRVAVASGCTFVQAVANARLVAAAPELLAELKNVTLLLRAALLCTTVEIAREARPHLDSADAAIAKAERKNDDAKR